MKQHPLQALFAWLRSRFPFGRAVGPGTTTPLQRPSLYAVGLWEADAELPVNLTVGTFVTRTWAAAPTERGSAGLKDFF